LKDRKVLVTVFGYDAAHSPGGCTCAGGLPGPISMSSDAEDLKKFLGREFKDAVEVRFVDVRSVEMALYPEVMAVLEKERLPVVAVDKKPRFFGGLSFIAIADEVKKVLEEKN